LGRLSCGSRRIALLGHLAHAITAGFPSFGGQRTTVALEPIQALGHTVLNKQGGQKMACHAVFKAQFPATKRAPNWAFKGTPISPSRFGNAKRGAP
jgi:hypothetical protein